MEWENEITMAKSMMAWHFVGKTLRDGRDIPPDGVELVHDGDLLLCVCGLHASERLIDALSYAPGNILCRVKCGGRIQKSDDKLVCTRRTIEWRLDSEEVLLAFADQLATMPHRLMSAHVSADRAAVIARNRARRGAPDMHNKASTEQNETLTAMVMATRK